MSLRMVALEVNSEESGARSTNDDGSMGTSGADGAATAVSLEESLDEVDTVSGDGEEETEEEAGDGDGRVEVEVEVKVEAEAEAEAEAT